MRYVGIILLVWIGVIACKQKASGDKSETAALLGTTYTIKGIVEGADTSEMVVLQYLGVDKSDTTYTKAKQFSFKGRVQEPVMAIIYLPNSLNEQSRALSFMLENATINIEGNKDSLHKATVVGGLANNDYSSLKKILQLYDDKVKGLTQQAEQAQGSNDLATLQNLQVQYNQTNLDKKLAIKQYVTDNPSSVAAAFYVYQDLTSDFDSKSLDTVYRTFDSSLLNSVYVQKIKESLDIINQTEIGKPAPEITLNNVNGKAVSLSSLKGKYVLVDFWASWCGPCRQENPNVVNAYQKYKGKGFTILGVSLDEDKAAWKQAIQKDNLTWTHISDLKGWESSAAATYGVRSIPSNFLLDKDGIIIARDLREAALTDKLAQILP